MHREKNRMGYLVSTLDRSEKRLQDKGGGGKVILTVIPIAVHMGSIDPEKQLNKRFINNGDQWVCNMETLKRDLLGFGLGRIISSGCWLEPGANTRINKNWNGQYGRCI